MFGMKTTDTNTQKNFVPPKSEKAFFHGKKIPQTWIVVADHGKAMIYKAGEQLEPIAKMTPDENRLDIDPNNSSGTVGRTGVHFAGDPRDRDNHHEEGLFIRDLAKWLEDKQEDYDQLILIADPRALGELRKFLCPGLQKFVKSEIAKNLTGLSIPDLQRHLKETLTL